MGMLRVRCEQCKGTWDVYGARDFTNDHNRVCPHCGHKVESMAWHTHVLPAFAAMMEANRELIRMHVEHGPLFTVDYVEDCVFDGVGMTDLYDRLAGLEDTLGNLLYGSGDQAGVLAESVKGAEGE